MRKNVLPSSTRNDTKNVTPKFFDSFSRGTIKDPPAEILYDCLADSKNISTHPRHYEGRLGCRSVGSANFPTMVTGIVASKNLNNIIATTSVFTRHHIGCFFNFGGTFELITDYVSPTTVVGEDSVYRESLAGSIIGNPILMDMHSSVRLLYLLIGTEFYYSGTSFSWTKIKTISPSKAFMRESMVCEYKNKAIVFNPNGMFKVDIDKTYPVAYQINIIPPTARINDGVVPESATKRYRYIFSVMRLEGTGIVDRQTQGSVIDFETGTNVKDANGIDYAECQTESAISSDDPVVVSYVGVPLMNGQLQHHVTHYPIYRTLDLESINPLDPNKSKYNDPNVFVWVKDLRCCAAFYCHVESGHLYVDRGSLEVADVGSVLYFVGGQHPTIDQFISETEAILSDGALSLSGVACAIGSQVLQGIITDGVLHRTDGGIFSSNIDLPLYNSDGNIIYITEYLTSSSVRTNVAGDQPEQGYAFSPSYRSFNDTITDETLAARKDFYTCRTRYKEALPNCNMGSIIPGFVVVGQRWQKKVYYSNVEPGYDYLMGNYIPIQTSDTIEDAITFIRKFQDVLSFICASSTWYMRLGLSEFATLPGSNEEVAIIPGIKRLTGDIGCADYGSIVEIPGDAVALITNEGGEEAGRIFYGTSYSDADWMVDSSFGGRMVKAMRKTKRMSKAVYDGLMGLILWRKNE